MQPRRRTSLQPYLRCGPWYPPPRARDASWLGPERPSSSLVGARAGLADWRAGWAGWAGWLAGWLGDGGKGVDMGVDVDVDVGVDMAPRVGTGAARRRGRTRQSQAQAARVEGQRTSSKGGEPGPGRRRACRMWDVRIHVVCCTGRTRCSSTGGGLHVKAWLGRSSTREACPGPGLEERKQPLFADSSWPSRPADQTPSHPHTLKSHTHPWIMSWAMGHGP